jgi:Domain of unknown function (DUF4397)
MRINMMKKIVTPLLLLLCSLQGCLKDPDPITQTINTYQFYYNYFLEPYGVQWKIDDVVIGSNHSYGYTAKAIAILEQSEQELVISAGNTENGQLIDSLSFPLKENFSYMVALLGTEEETHLLCEPMDTRRPSAGMVKLRFLHAAAAMGSVDIYVGGYLPENKVLSGVSYTSVSEYLEFTEEKLWNAILVTPTESLPADSTILSYTVNTFFDTGCIYLCTIAHSENSIESLFQMDADDQPVY